MIKTRLFTSVISFCSVWINKTGRAGQQKLKIFYSDIIWVSLDISVSGKRGGIPEGFVQQISDIYRQKWFSDTVFPRINARGVSFKIRDFRGTFIRNFRNSGNRIFNKSN